MSSIITEVQVLQMIMSGSAGLVGVGIGIGMFRTTIKQVKEDVAKIRRRQAKLRGEDNGSKPLYVSKDTCRDLRGECGARSDGKMQAVCDDLISHTKAIKSLDNFARWWMQKEGLLISEINEILGEK